MLDKPLFGNTEQRAFLARSRAFVHFSLSDDVTIGLTFNAWVRVDDVDYLGVMAVMTDGMRRFGLPELRMGPASPDLREELTALLNGAAFRIWSDLLARANDTPEGRRPGAPAAFPERAGRDGHPPPRPGASRIVAAPSPPSACVSIGHKARIRGGG